MVVILIVAGIAIYEAFRASQLSNQILIVRQENRSLSGQIQTLLREREESTRRIASMASEIARLQKGTTELVKLRAEVARVNSLQKDLTAIQKLATPDPSGWRPSDLTNVGRATPQDALRTYLWSATTTNLTELAASVTPDEVDPALGSDIVEFTDNPQNHLHQGDFLNVKIISQKIVNPNEVQLEVHAQTDASSGVSKMLTLRNVEGQWKMVLFNVRDENGKVTQVQFGTPSMPR